MSHQTGITASAELDTLFNNARKGLLRAIKVKIVGETLEHDASVECSSSFTEDYKKVVPTLLDNNNGSYVLVRTDEKQKDGSYYWVFLQYLPDACPVREKMLYAATKASFKRIFGNELIKDDIYGTRPEDVIYDGYVRHITARDAPPPLTAAEKEYEEIKEQEKAVAIDQKAETLPGVSFPVNSRILEEFEKMKTKDINYIEIFVNSSKEELSFKESGKISLEELRKKKFSEPRYHIFHYPHTFEGEEFESTVFIYSMPGYSCPVKHRMLYSSCKGPLLIYFESKGIKFEKKFELEGLIQLTEDFLNEEIHPRKVQEKVAFSKPKRPGRR